LLPADIDMAKDLMLEVCEHRAQNGIVESATLAALSERTPSWFMAAREYNKLGYASQDWNDEADLALSKGEIVIAGDDTDGWRQGYIRSFPQRIGMFPSRGADANGEIVHFIRSLSWEEVAALVEGEGLFGLMVAESSFDAATYGDEWNADADHAVIRGELLILPSEPDAEGWARAVKLSDYSQGAVSGVQAWLDVPECKQVPATDGFLRRIDSADASRAFAKLGHDNLSQ
jgi:hypothetical protein